MIDAGEAQSRCDSGNTLLFFARTAQDVFALISSGVDPNLSNADGVTPIFAAAVRGDAEVIRALAEAGADPNLSDNSLWETPLHIAVNSIQLAAVAALLDVGADPHLMDISGSTPLDNAVRYRLEEITALLQPYSVPAAEEQGLYSSGDWRLIEAYGYGLSLFGGDYVFDAICVARTRSVAGRIDIGMFQKGWAEFAPEVIGALLGEIVIPGQDFETATHDVTLISGAGSYTITDAEHSGETIQFVVEAQNAPASALSLLAMMAGEDFRVESEASTEPVLFSPNGFADVTNALLECAGVN